MFVAKWYTRASRIRIVIAKFDGRWKIPGGPYPIPELAALVAGIIATLFLLPRLGHPVGTGFAGLAVTAGLVAWMRRMPYSPVKFGTRVHRVARLYTSPATFTSGGDLLAGQTVSVVRPQIDILDVIPSPVPSTPWQNQTDARPAWAAMFDHQRSGAAELFG